jgi:hypothetical protein
MRIAFMTPAATAFFALLLLWDSCSADETDRAAAAAALFDSYCLSKPTDFAQLGQRATEAHYEVIIDRNAPMPNGGAIKQKNWLVPSATGVPMMLTSTDATNGSRHVFGCGIYASNLNGKTMESALSSLSRLGAPARYSQVPRRRLSGVVDRACWRQSALRRLGSHDVPRHTGNAWSGCRAHSQNSSARAGRDGFAKMKA